MIFEKIKTNNFIMVFSIFIKNTKKNNQKSRQKDLSASNKKSYDKIKTNFNSDRSDEAVIHII